MSKRSPERTASRAASAPAARQVTREAVGQGRCRACPICWRGWSTLGPAALRRMASAGSQGRAPRMLNGILVGGCGEMIAAMASGPTSASQVTRLPRPIRGNRSNSKVPAKSPSLGHRVRFAICITPTASVPAKKCSGALSSTASRAYESWCLIRPGS